MDIAKIFNNTGLQSIPVENVQQIKKHLKRAKSPQDMRSSELMIDQGHIQQIVEEANEFIQLTETNIEFHLHEKLGEYYVTVIDVETEEVIREIPPEQLLDMYAGMLEFVGLLVDEKI